MNRGCPHRCLFCNERLTAGDRPERITEAAFAETVRAHLAGAGRKSGPIQIAFYGGTFTGMEREEQSRLLELAAPFLREGTVDGIRISTRPDGIDAEGLDLLRSLRRHDGGGGGAIARRRGSSPFAAGTYGGRHRPGDVPPEGNGLQNGIHLMAGLPGDSPEPFRRNDRPGDRPSPRYGPDPPDAGPAGHPPRRGLSGRTLSPAGLAEAVGLCKNALKALTAAGIPVIRLGLQTTRELEEPGAVVAGPFHPAFRSLVESALFLEMAVALLSSAGRETASCFPADTVPEVAPTSPSPRPMSRTSTARQRENIRTLKERFGLGGYPHLVRSRPSPADTRPDSRRGDS